MKAVDQSDQPPPPGRTLQRRREGKQASPRTGRANLLVLPRRRRQGLDDHRGRSLRYNRSSAGGLLNIKGGPIGRLTEFLHRTGSAIDAALRDELGRALISRPSSVADGLAPSFQLGGPFSLPGISLLVETDSLLLITGNRSLRLRNRLGILALTMCASRDRLPRSPARTVRRE